MHAGGPAGEVMGIDTIFPAAYAKAQIAAGQRLPLEGTIFVSMADKYKEPMVPIARELVELGYKLVATGGCSAASKPGAGDQGRGLGLGLGWSWMGLDSKLVATAAQPQNLGLELGLGLGLGCTLEGAGDMERWRGCCPAGMSRWCDSGRCWWVGVPWLLHVPAGLLRPTWSLRRSQCHRPGPLHVSEVQCMCPVLAT